MKYVFTKAEIAIAKKRGSPATKKRSSKKKTKKSKTKKKTTGTRSTTHGANNVRALAKITGTLRNQGYNVKVSKPKKGKSKYVVKTVGKKKKKGKGSIRLAYR